MPDYWYEFTLPFYHTDHLAYFRRLLNYIRGSDVHVAPSPSPVSIFKDILTSLKEATEKALGVEMSPVGKTFNARQWHYTQGKPGNINVRVGAPWALNFTMSRAMRIALEELHLWSDYHGGRLHQLPTTLDAGRDYSGERGTALAFEQARALVEMAEFDPYIRYGEPTCGTYLVALEKLRREHAQARHKNDLRKQDAEQDEPEAQEEPTTITTEKILPDALFDSGVFDLPCRDFSECFWGFVKAQSYDLWDDGEYWRWYFGL